MQGVAKGSAHIVHSLTLHNCVANRTKAPDLILNRRVLGPQVGDALFNPCMIVHAILRLRCRTTTGLDFVETPEERGQLIGAAFGICVRQNSRFEGPDLVLQFTEAFRCIGLFSQDLVQVALQSDTRIAARSGTREVVHNPRANAVPC